jgi:Fic family protein
MRQIIVEYIMQDSDFICAEVGRLVPTLFGQNAFVPAALPPAIDHAAITFQLAEAMSAIGELRGACRLLQNPAILIRPLQRQEALTSSAMEGTYTTADKLVLAEAGVGQAADESTREVSNYISALNLALMMEKDFALTHRVIKAAHARLLEGLSSERGSKKRPGEYKTDQNFIGSLTRKIEDARFIPPPPAETEQCMNDLEKYLNRSIETSAERLIDMALVHYQIETIHPFGDGNGRLGRMLITLMGVTHGLLDHPVLYISPSIEHEKDRYIDLMYNVSSKGEWTAWLNFFFEKITISCKNTILTIDKLLQMQARLRKKVGDAIRSSNALTLIDSLFEYPAITISQASTKMGVTYAAAKNLIDKLIELEILIEVPDEYPKTYIAWEIILGVRPEAK